MADPVTPAAPVEPAVPAAPVADPAAPAALVAAPVVPASLIDPAAPGAPAEPAAPVVPAEPSLVPDPPAASWYLSEGVGGEGEAPVWFKGDKYKTIADQAQAYPELEKRGYKKSTIVVG